MRDRLRDALYAIGFGAGFVGGALYAIGFGAGFVGGFVRGFIEGWYSIRRISQCETKSES